MANQFVPSSSFSTTPSWTYDVFLSFRGEDTRYNFTDHLYRALDHHGINTFIDHHELQRGEEISPSLLKAIRESRISVIIFSENYASSRWCLDELVHILECSESKGQMTRPIFYKVDPSDVRHQTNSYGTAFADHSRKYENDLEKVQRWRTALTKAANLKGDTLNEKEYETTFIDRIVEEISIQLANRTCLNVAKYPIGLEFCAKEVEELLGVGGNDRRVVGIWGTSGIGKTTIAKAVYNAIAHKFEGSCFLADVSETSASREGPIQLQKALLSKILRGAELNIVNAHEGISLIKNRLGQKKILLILDDVDKLEQLNAWVDVECFGEGSRVIITTKDRSLLDFYGGEWIYEVQKLEDDKALELFSLNAFERNRPPADYLILAHRAIDYAQGLPLALNLIGSHLRKKSIDSWKAILDGYKPYDGEPYTNIQRILRKSYDAWDYGLQQVFLDIACFYKGENKDYVLQILKSSTLNVREDCIEVLVKKAIITTEDDRIWMHDLLQKMGKQIVHEEASAKPGERSRLWFHKDVYDVLTENQGTEKIRSIVVKLPTDNVIPLKTESFLRMVNLEIFINHNAKFSGCVDYLPNSLRWFDLSGRLYFEIKHPVEINLPSNFHPRHLVRFDMPFSGIRQLNGFKNLANLTSMNLSGCKFLKKIPDLSRSPNIKSLNLKGCKNLVEVDDSVGFLDELDKLDVRWCSKLTRLPTRLGLRSLRSLSLYRCTRLESFPEVEEGKMESLRSLDIRESGIRELPSSIAYLTGLSSLVARGCENLTNINIRSCPKPITSTLPRLCRLDLEGCNLSESDFLVPLDCWSTLEYLNLSGNNFVSLPDCISKFVNLDYLKLSGCKRLREIPQVLPPIVCWVNLEDCTSLEKIPKLTPMLRGLQLRNCCRLSGDEVAKLENNLLNSQESPGLESILYPGNEVPKWFSYASNHPTIIREGFSWKTSEEEVVQEGEFSFEIPLNLQVGKTFLGLALSIVFEPSTYYYGDSCILINGIELDDDPFPEGANVLEATHVWLRFVCQCELKRQGDICQVKFHFFNSASIKSCGVHLLLRNQNKQLPLSLEQADDHWQRWHIDEEEEYDREQQWVSLSLEPANDHRKRRQIDLNIPTDSEEEKEEQQQEYDHQQQWVSLSLEPVDDHRKRMQIDLNIPTDSEEEDEEEQEYDRQQQWVSLSLEPADDHRKRKQTDLNIPTDSEEEDEQEQKQEYDRQQQWVSLSLEPGDDHRKRRQIDLNIPTDSEEEEDEQEQEQEYDQQQQWVSLSLEPADDHRKRRQIDLNIPTDSEEEEEEQEYDRKQQLVSLSLEPAEDHRKRRQIDLNIPTDNEEEEEEQEYDRQQQWVSLSLEPTDDHRKRRQIDLNIPTDSEEEEEEQEQEQKQEYDRQQQWVSLSLEPGDDHQKRRQIDLNIPTDSEEEDVQEQEYDRPRQIDLNIPTDNEEEEEEQEYDQEQ